MCMLTYRTNVLFDEEYRDHLTLLSQMSRKTIGELIRDAVKKTYKIKKKALTANEKAYRAIRKITKGMNFSGIDYKALIEYGRKY